MPALRPILYPDRNSELNCSVGPVGRKVRSQIPRYTKSKHHPPINPFEIDAVPVHHAPTTMPGSATNSGIRDIPSVLKRLKGSSIECLGRGRTAKWRKTTK